MRWLMVLLLAGALVAWGETADDIEATLKGGDIDTLTKPAKPASPLPETGAGLKVPEVPPDFPGATTRVVDPYRANAPNPLFLTSLPGKFWWDEQATARLPVLVTEPVGLSRRSQPVSVITTFPEGTVPASVRVVTPYGRELPSQVRVVDAPTRELEVVFVLDRLDAAAQVPLFVYYGRQPLDRPLAAGDPCLRAEEREQTVLLTNSRLQAELSKIALPDKYPLWRQIRSQGAEYSQIGTYAIAGYPERGCGVPAGTPLRVLEDGPVRKTVSYGAWGEAYTVSLYANSPLLCVASKSGIQSWGFWFPGGDTLNDVLCYASSEGLKRMPIQYSGGNVEPFTYMHLRKWYKEGWFGLFDEAQQQGIGWFFDLEQSRLFLQTVFLGYWVSVHAPGQSALYVASSARTEPCREAYIAWKCPPIVSCGAPQAVVKTAPSVPLLGTDFIRMHLEIERFRPRHDANSARDYVEEAQAFGANVLMYESSWHGEFTYMKPSVGPDGKPGPALLDELARECHARGVGLYHGLNTGCSVTHIRDMVRRGVDGVWLTDEWGWGPDFGYYPLNEELRKQFLAGTGGWEHPEFTKAERADFKRRYGVDLPAPATAAQKVDREIDEAMNDTEPQAQGMLEVPKVAANPQDHFPWLAANNLKNPAHLAVFRMLIDAHNLLMSDLAQVARENNPKVFVAATTSPNNLVIPYSSRYVPRSLAAFHDLESLAEGLSSITLDLYSNDAGWLNSMIKYARGAQGNRRPMLVIGGYCGWDNRLMVENNLNFQLMLGANSVCYFALDRLCTPWPGLGAKDAFDLMDYTGLGAFAAKAWPLEYVGVLRDRDEFFASLKRGETLTPNGTGSVYEQTIFQFFRSLDFDLPTNIIAAKHLKAELAAPYKLVMVPSNATLSEANAALLRQFAEAGGNLIVEYATVRNATIAALAKVSPTGEPKSGALRLTGALAPLKEWTATLTGAWQPLKAEPGAEVLATLADGTPAITRAAAGKGSVVCLAPRVGPQAASEPVRSLLRRLVSHAIGYVPVQLELLGGGAWPTVLTDGERYLIGIYNDTDRPREGLGLILTGFPPALAQVVSLRTGRTSPIVNGVARGLDLSARRTDYFLLAPKLPRPQAVEQTAMPISQSLTPGMTFLSLPPLPAAKR